MKRLKLWGLATSVLIIVAFIATGALGCKIRESSKDDLLSLTKIIKAFEAENFPLEEDRSKSPADYDLNGVEPAIYGTGENKDLILIYNFKSYSEKEKILDETDKYNNHFSYEEFPFHAKNSLIVFRPSEMAETEEGLENITKTRSIISRIVFEELNEGKERVYKGKSENWEGTYTYKYYEHWYEGEDGLLYRSYEEYHPVIKYTKSDIENVGPIIFEYKAGTSSGRGEGITLNEDGYAKLGGGSSNGSILREGEKVHFNIRWGNKEEHIVLNAQ